MLGGGRPSNAEATAREALARAKQGRRKDAVHVVQRQDGWAVKTERRDRAASVQPTKQQAVKVAKAQAAAHGARLIEHAVGGKILRNTKPNPPSAKRK